MVLMTLYRGDVSHTSHSIAELSAMTGHLVMIEAIGQLLIAGPQHDIEGWKIKFEGVK